MCCGPRMHFLTHLVSQIYGSTHTSFDKKFLFLKCKREKNQDFLFSYFLFSSGYFNLSYFPFS